MVTALENQRVALKSRLDDRGEKNASLEQQLKSAYQDFNDLNAELSSVKSAAQRQAERGRILRALLAERDGQVAKLDEKQEQLRTQGAALAEELGKVRALLSNREAQARATQENFVRERNSLDEQLAATARAVEELKRTLAAREASLQQSAAALDKSAAEEILLQKLIAQKAAELDGMRIRLESAEAARGELATKIEDMETAAKVSREQLQAEARTARTHILRLQAELNKYRKVASLDRQQIERILRAQEQLREGMSTYLADNSLGIKQDKQRLTLQLSNQILFPSGSPVIKPEGLEALRDLGRILKERMGQLRIQVGGHTDNIPMSGSAAVGARGLASDNWGLSAARAVNVVRFFETEVGVDADRMAAVGYGEHRPVADNATRQGRAQNRRIEIVLIPH